VIPHVTPDVLCSTVLIPIPTAQELAQAQEKYPPLCELEAQAESAYQQIAEIVKELWQPQS